MDQSGEIQFSFTYKLYSSLQEALETERVNVHHISCGQKKKARIRSKFVDALNNLVAIYKHRDRIGNTRLKEKGEGFHRR